MVYIVSSIDFKYVVVIDNTVLHLSWSSIPASCTNIYRTYIHIKNYGLGRYRWMFHATVNNISVMCWWSDLSSRNPEYPGKTKQLGDRPRE